MGHLEGRDSDARLRIKLRLHKHALYGDLSWMRTTPTGCGFRFEFLVGFQVLTEMVIFWDITPCSPSQINRHFEGRGHLCLQGQKICEARNLHGVSTVLRLWKRRQCFLQMPVDLGRIKGIISQKVEFSIYNLFVYGFFNDAASSSDGIMSDDRMWSWPNFRYNADISLVYWGKQWKLSNRLESVPTEIRTGHLPTAIQMHCFPSQLTLWVWITPKLVK
jgi:hypothetical protein